MTLGWVQIMRLGLVQMALGSIVLLTTSTLNRLIVVELALPAVLPGMLVALHYGIQITRPRWGFRSDAGSHRTRWIIGGILVLGLGALGAAFGVVVLEGNRMLGLMISVLAYAMIGLGVGACGTSLLALLATATRPDRRAAAATIVWLMMIFGIAMTAGIAGGLLDPYSPSALIRVVGLVTSVAMVVTVLAVWGIEAKVHAQRAPEPTDFRQGLQQVWSEARTRNFTLFVFLSMTAYFMQELILEPYAGLVFGFTPGQSTSLSGAQNGGVLIGMLTVALAATGLGLGALRTWVIAGCLGSCGALLAIAGLGSVGPGAPLLPAVVALGVFNGMFAVAAIGAMMALAAEGHARREGTRMGLWGAAQALAAGFGGLAGAALVDLIRLTHVSDARAFGMVFGIEACLFIAAAGMAAVIMEGRAGRPALLSGG